MVARLRFWSYRNLIAVFTWFAFRSQKVLPLEAPVAGTVEFRRYAEVYPGLPVKELWIATTFPDADRASKRLRRIRLEQRLIGLVKAIAPRATPPVPQDADRFVGALYPRIMRAAWPAAPAVPAALTDADDLIAELAVRGPFASYLRRVDDGSYAVDVNWLGAYEVFPELARPGGIATFTVHDGRLVTETVTTGRVPYLAGLNEDLTTFRHNLSVHLAMLTPFALASTNFLDAEHPVRRLLHHCFNTVLIGNVELASAQLSGQGGFSASIFSHDAGELLRMVDDYLGRFDFWDFEPDTQFERRGTVNTPFAYPYRDNILRLWSPTRAYVAEYLRLYYEDDDDIAKDSELASWAGELDRLVPNGVGVPIGGVTFDWLARACATLIHVSTVEHDYLNNVVWNYSTLSWLVPTVAPLSGEPMDRRRAFDLIATIIGTWKPYNMLLTSGVSVLALDDRAATVMSDWIEQLARIQADMDAEGSRDASLSYPANLNVSISN